MTRTFYARAGKRWLDATAAFLGLIAVSPLFLLVALAIRITSRGPVFFRQVRVGQFGKTFRIFKFRSMHVVKVADESLLTAAGDSRITAVGRWLRRTKLDEFPQLLNVLTGDMSLVGPRPEVPRYTAAYSEEERRVLLAKPGITGPAAVKYVNEEELLAGQPDKDSFYLTTLLPAKLAIDLSYCANVCFFEDLKILFGTFGNVLWSSGPIATPTLPAPVRQHQKGMAESASDTL